LLLLTANLLANERHRKKQSIERFRTDFFSKHNQTGAKTSHQQRKHTKVTLAFEYQCGNVSSCAASNCTSTVVFIFDDDETRVVLSIETKHHVGKNKKKQKQNESNLGDGVRRYTDEFVTRPEQHRHVRKRS
jgi:hypothetical protein